MPRAFDDLEQAAITERLKRAGRELFAAQGVVKTSIEELTVAAGISKGSFYKFYANKETLFFELLEESQDRIREPLLSDQNSRTPMSRKRLAEITASLLADLSIDPFIRIMGRERELQAVTRRVSAARLQQHKTDDQAFIAAVIEKWNTKSQPPSSDQVAACLTMLVLIGLQGEFFGTKLLPIASDTAVANFCDCFFDDSSTRN